MKKIKLITRTVQVPDNERTGALMRKARERAGIGLRELARRLKLSAPYVSDLELGRRSWTPERVEQWRKEIEKGVKNGE